MRLLLASVLVLAVSPVMAQEPPCGPTGAIEKHIAEKFGESVVGAGITTAGVMFITAKPETGSFTVMLRGPDGRTCILSGGTGWASVDADKPQVGL